MYKLIVRTHFDAAHHIQDYLGKCSREHGHRWNVDAVLEGSELDELNMLIDFVEVKLALGKIVDECLDHYNLNKTLKEHNVTAEFLSKYVFGRLYNVFKYAHTPPINHRILDAVKRGVKLISITIWESLDCGVEYKE